MSMSANRTISAVAAVDLGLYEARIMNWENSYPGYWMTPGFVVMDEDDNDRGRETSRYEFETWAEARASFDGYLSPGETRTIRDRVTGEVLLSRGATVDEEKEDMFNRREWSRNPWDWQTHSWLTGCDTFLMLS